MQYNHIVGMRELFAKGCKLTGRQRSADRFHWIAMEFIGYWRQRLSVALGRGRARCLGAAAVFDAIWILARDDYPLSGALERSSAVLYSRFSAVSEPFLVREW